MPLHFLADEASHAHPGDRVALTGAEAHHAATVRRLRVGEEVTVGDGRGVWLSGVCEQVASREVVVEVSSRREEPAPAPRLVLVQALAKGDRDELAVQAATELGVDEVVPWQAARSVSRWTPASLGSTQRAATEGRGRREAAAKAEKGRARWDTIAREAAKQAHRAWLPTVAEPAALRELAARAGTSRMLVLDPEGAERLSAVVLDPVDARDVVFVVGPEGGIAPEELAALEAAGARRVRLGDTVLRTSTAGPSALTVANVLLGRW